jgi:two-component system KDP operon response regulator KdpE
VIAGSRGWTSVPIIVLSARTDASEKVDALDAGADDYVTTWPGGRVEGCCDTDPVRLRSASS